LNGTASGSGTITTTWSKFSGPGTVTFGNVSALSTTASFSTSGTYVLQLAGTNAGGTSTSNVTITVNPAPATLAWDPSTSSVAGYNIYRSEQSGVYGAPLNGAVLTSTTFTDSTLQSGHTYFYVTKAVATGGTVSGPSNEVSVSR
jgi:predicted phage tail protein